jgi:hypothetical protein
MNQTDLTYRPTGRADPRPPLKRSNRKAVDAAQRMLADQATAIDQAHVCAGPNPMLVGLVGAAILVVLLVLTGINFAFLLVPAVNVIRTPRNLVLADRGLALFRSTYLLRQPIEMLGTYAADALIAGEGETWLGYVNVRLGPGHVWIRTKDRDRLLAANRH